ncbi:MAG: type II and III secretion system protein family protein [Xanthobacteraceae bacterium]
MTARMTAATTGSRKLGLRIATFIAVIAAGVIAPRALAGNVGYSGPPPQVVHISASDVTSQPLALGVSKSIVVDLPRDIKDVLVADPKIANAVVRSARRAYIIGSAAGQTNVYFFDAQGQQIAGFDIAVTRDLNGMRQAIHQVLPDSDITVEGIGDGIVLAGTASSQAEAQQAYDIAARILNSATADTVGQGSKIVNAIVVRAGDQVMLKVVVAEVERDIIKQLGINLAGSVGYGTTVLNFNNSNPFTALGQSLSGSFIQPTYKFPEVSATLQAMEQAGVIHTLAEPNLTAISGESATFVAGGEFPVLNGFSCSAATTVSTTQTCQPSIDFKKFGVSLNFTPIVLSAGRISLKVMTEVSDLSSNNSIQIVEPGTSPQVTVTVPSIRTRRAETTVEIPSGGSLAMAGMIQNSTKQNINGLPGLMELPILGPLFKSRDYLNQQTELMVLVTPYVVHAVAQKELSRPDDGFADSSDPAAVLLGRFNRIYGVGGMPDPPDTYRGRYGFILD